MKFEGAWQQKFRPVFGLIVEEVCLGMESFPKEDPVSGSCSSEPQGDGILSLLSSEFLEAASGEEASVKFKARGWSMLPSIRDGDILTVSSVAGPDIEIGTPVVFRCPRTKMVLAHRVIDRISGRYLMKGDRAFKADGFVPRKSILGVVTTVERKGEKVVWGLGAERHLLAFLSRTRVLFFLFEIWKRIPAPVRSFLRHD